MVGGVRSILRARCASHVIGLLHAARTGCPARLPSQEPPAVGTGGAKGQTAAREESDCQPGVWGERNKAALR